MRSLLSFFVLACYWACIGCSGPSLQKIKKEFENGNLEETIELSNQALKHTENSQILFYRANSYLQLEQYEKAYEDYFSLINQNQQNFSTYYGAAYSAKQLKKEVVSISFYQKSLAFPECVDLKKIILLNIADSYLHLVQFDSAENFYQRIIQEDSAFCKAYGGMGVCKQLQGQWQNSIDYFVKGAQLCPDDDRLYYNIASSFHQMGKDQEALLYMDQGIALSIEDNARYLYGKGAILINLGKTCEACEYIYQALKLGYTDVDANIDSICAACKERKVIGGVIM